MGKNESARVIHGSDKKGDDGGESARQNRRNRRKRRTLSASSLLNVFPQPEHTLDADFDE